MKKLFHPASVLLYFMAFIVFFFVGAYYAILSGASSGQGLAAAGIVVGTGIFAAFAAFFAAMIAAWHMDTVTIRKFNRIMALVLLVFIVVTTIRAIQRKHRKGDDPAPEMTPKPTVPARLIAASDLRALSYPETTGLGLFFTRFSPDQPLLFYSNPDRSRDHQPTAVDSVVFSGLVGMPQIATAPPWLVPERLVADYQIMLFVVVSIQKNYVEVVVNTRTHKTLYVDRTAGQFVYWPDFLLDVAAVEPIDRARNPVRTKPLHGSSALKAEYDHLRVVAARDEWLYVELRLRQQSVGNGWIRWRSNGQLLVTYDLLS